MENVLGEILSGFRFSYKKNFKKQTGSWMQTYGTGGNLEAVGIGLHHSTCHIVFLNINYSKTQQSRLKYEIKYDLYKIAQRTKT